LSSPIWDGSSSLSVIGCEDSFLSSVLSPIGDEDRARREGEDRRRERPLRVFFARVSSMLSGVLLMVSLCNDCRSLSLSCFVCEALLVVSRCSPSVLSGPQP
jgi:hypothetical protein